MSHAASCCRCHWISQRALLLLNVQAVATPEQARHVVSVIQKPLTEDPNQATSYTTHCNRPSKLFSELCWGCKIRLKGETSPENTEIIPSLCPSTSQVTCGSTGSRCLDKPVFARDTYHGTHVADVSRPYPSKHDNIDHVPSPATHGGILLLFMTFALVHNANIPPTLCRVAQG